MPLARAFPSRRVSTQPPQWQRRQASPALLEIVEPIQHPLSVLQQTHKDTLDSMLLFVSDEILPLEPTNRDPASLQKLPTSKHPTPPAAAASAPLLSSALIAPIPLF